MLLEYFIKINLIIKKMYETSLSFFLHMLLKKEKKIY